MTVPSASMTAARIGKRGVLAPWHGDRAGSGLPPSMTKSPMSHLRFTAHPPPIPRGRVRRRSRHSPSLDMLHKGEDVFGRGLSRIHDEIGMQHPTRSRLHRSAIPLSPPPRSAARRNVPEDCETDARARCMQRLRPLPAVLVGRHRRRDFLAIAGRELNISTRTTIPSIGWRIEWR